MLDVQTVIYREGRYVVAQCLDVDVSTFGTSDQEALANLREALELYFEDAPDAVLSAVREPKVRKLTFERA